MGEAHLATPDRQLRELVRVVEARHRQVLGRGPQVLAEREDLHVRRPEVRHGGQQLVPLFAQAQDDPRLGHEPGRSRAGAAEQLERALVAAPVARHLVEPRHRLGIVVQHVGPRFDDRRERGGAALEVRDEQLDAAAGGVAANRLRGRREVRGPAVRQVVTVHGGDHHVLEPQLSDRPAHPLRLLAILPDRPAVGHRAVAAIAGAHVAQDHEGRGEILPALPDVRAVRLLTDRMEVPLAHQALEPDVLRSARRAHPEPRRLG